MSVLTFDKKELGNLEYSLQREMLATDRRGGYMSTTIVCCNTRKYHGLMVAPIDDSDRAYVLLSSVDETVVHDGQSFNLALHRFPGTYEPRGHKYITDFEYTPTPTITYRVGSIVLRKELLWIHNRTQLMIRYTLLEAPSDVRLRLRPFFAFRDKHALTHANMEADGRSRPIPGGVKCRLYSDFPGCTCKPIVGMRSSCRLPTGTIISNTPERSSEDTREMRICLRRVISNSVSVGGKA